MNYNTFYAQGQKSAHMGNARSPGNEYRMPVFGEGNSWQARAFADGFIAECEKLGRPLDSLQDSLANCTIKNQVVILSR